MKLTDEGVYEETKRILREQASAREDARRRERERRIYQHQLNRLAAEWAIERALYDPRPRSERRAAHPVTQAA